MLLKRRPDGDLFTSPKAYNLLSQAMSLGRRDVVFDRAAALLGADLDAVGPTASIVDVGCGTGALTMALARRFPAADVLGIDPGADMIAQARRDAERHGLRATFETGVAQELSLVDGSIDAVSFSLSFHHVPSEHRPAALDEAYRVLRPGGRILVVEIVPHGRLGKVFSLHGHDPTADLDVPGSLERAGFADVNSGRITQRLLGWWLATRTAG